MPLYLSIVLPTKEHAPTPCSSIVFSLGLTFESLKEMGVRQYLGFVFKKLIDLWKWVKNINVLQPQSQEEIYDLSNFNMENT
jgi:hypothetical protein